MIEAEKGVPFAKQRLIYGGKPLQDSQKLGTDCKIQNETVIHLVEKTVPTDSAGSSNGAASSSPQNPPPQSTSPGAGQFLFPHGPVQANIPGANVVIRAVQFGYDPVTGIATPVTPPVPQPSGSPQPAPTASGTTQSAQQSEPTNAAQGQNPAANAEFPQQMANVAAQAANFASQILQGLGIQTGPVQTAPSGMPAQQPGANANPAQTAPAGQAAPTPGQPAFQLPHFMMGPPISPLVYLHNALIQWEDAVLPQFENHIRGLASDLVSSDSAASSSDSASSTRTYEINIGNRTGGALSGNPSLQVPPNAETYSPQALWRRLNAIQRRWLAIVEAIEGDVTCYGSLTNSTVSATLVHGGTSTSLPKLRLSHTHPLRHQLEHWSPHLIHHLGAVLSQLSPVLAQQHNTVHHPRGPHQPAPGFAGPFMPTGNPTQSAHAAPQQEAQAGQPRTAATQPSASAHPQAHATTPQQGPQMTFGMPGQAGQPQPIHMHINLTARNPAEMAAILNQQANHLSNQAQHLLNQAQQMYTQAQALQQGQQGQGQGQPAQTHPASDPSAQALAPAVSFSEPISQAAAPAATHEAHTSTSSNQPSTSAVPATTSSSTSHSSAPTQTRESASSAASTTTTEPTPSASSSAGRVAPAPQNKPPALSDEEFMAQWNTIVERDAQRQPRNATQRPFSDAYIGEPSSSHDPSSISSISRSSGELLSSLLTRSEESMRGSGTNGPLATSTAPPNLVASFNNILRREMSDRLNTDSDWNALEAQAQAESRFPALHQVFSQQKKSPK